MTIRVFSTGASPRPETRLVLSAEESHYLVRVRRATAGTEIEVLDGTGGAWRGRVAVADRRSATVMVGAALDTQRMGPRLDLLLGLPDPATTLETVARCCELGVSSVVLVACERSQGASPSPDRLARVLRSAQRQCGRPDPLRVTGPMSLDAALARPDAGLGFFASERMRGTTTELGTVDGASSMFLLVGPEGGLTDTEHRRVEQRALTPIGLGPWTLRTGTAAIVGLALLVGARGTA